MKVTDISNEIKKKIVQDREKDYGDYQYNFSVLADLFTLILAENLKKKPKTFKRRDHIKKEPNYKNLEELEKKIILKTLGYIKSTFQNLLKDIKFDEVSGL